MNDSYFNPEEQFYCIREAFDHVKAEVEQNDQDLMDCMIRLYADDQQKGRRYE